MKMPVDVLTDRLGKLKDNLMLDGDYTSYAISIDEELQRKFLFFPIEELESLEEQVEENRDGLYLGQGVGYATCPLDTDPQDLLTRAENALVLYQYLKKRQGPVTDNEIQHAIEAVEFQLSVEQDRKNPNPATVTELERTISTLQRIQQEKQA